MAKMLKIGFKRVEKMGVISQELGHFRLDIATEYPLEYRSTIKFTVNNRCRLYQSVGKYSSDSKGNIPLSALLK